MVDPRTAGNVGELFTANIKKQMIALATAYRNTRRLLATALLYGALVNPGVQPLFATIDGEPPPQVRSRVPRNGNLLRRRIIPTWSVDIQVAVVVDVNKLRAPAPTAFFDCHVRSGQTGNL